jgi:hypothetical protein
VTRNDKILVTVMALIKDGQKDISDTGSKLERKILAGEKEFPSCTRDDLVVLSYRQEERLKFLRSELNRMRLR